MNIWLTLLGVGLTAGGYLYGLWVARKHYRPLLREAYEEGVDAALRETRYS